MPVQLRFGGWRETKDYPAAKIVPDDEADQSFAISRTTMRDGAAATCRGDRSGTAQEDHGHEAGPAKRFAVYAKNLSRIYEAPPGFTGRNGQPDRAEAMASLRLELWRN
jgi:hypothetical protein